MLLTLLFFTASALQAGPPAKTEKPLRIYFVDVEGGQSTLIVAPSGQSLLVDTGWPDFNGRDARRIAAAARKAHIERIDDLIITHYHEDHVGGVPQLVRLLHIGRFIDHGADVQTGKEDAKLFAGYLAAAGQGVRWIVKPGDKFSLGAADIQILTANGQHIDSLLTGAGGPNLYCADVKRRANDPSENARSVGFLLTFGKFRFIDLGDLTWNKELDLMCPNNRVGRVDVFLVSHHGLAVSNSPALVWALHPRVAIMNNGAAKGADPQAWKIVKASPGLKALWQLHYAVKNGKHANVARAYIANMGRPDGNDIELTARPDGTFTVTNSRNGFTKSYATRMSPL